MFVNVIQYMYNMYNFYIVSKIESQYTKSKKLKIIFTIYKNTHTRYNPMCAKIKNYLMLSLTLSTVLSISSFTLFVKFDTEVEILD